MQREVRRGMTVEVDYNGSKGSNLHANLLNLNQVPLSGQRSHRQARHYSGGRPAEFAGRVDLSGGGGNYGAVSQFHQSCVPDVRASRSALRPYPQYGTVNTTDSGGDKPAARCITPVC